MLNLTALFDLCHGLMAYEKYMLLASRSCNYVLYQRLDRYEVIWSTTMEWLFSSPVGNVYECRCSRYGLVFALCDISHEVFHGAYFALSISIR
jgi:hypothetical protein